ncbi:MAG: serine hydrolase [Stenotrophomonas sp.]|nr:serine hydrolase [Stenotrophomonas sp.]
MFAPLLLLALAPSPFDAMLERTMQREQLPGIAMGVIEDGKVVYRRAEGSRGGTPDGRIDDDTLFKIASNSKAMTAALLARLVEQGKLRWDDPVRRHLPSFTMFDPWVGEQMQVRDLLIHNSGLGLGAGDLMLWPEPNHFTRADIIAGLAHLKPVTSFRSGYAYDNLMYVVAGEVAAAAGGKPYDQLMREQVFQPLGLSRCQAGQWSTTAVGNIAQPHVRRDGRNVVIAGDGDTSPDSPSMAAGGIRCSLNDMLRWMQVLLDPALVPDWLGSEQRRQLWTLQMPMPLGERQRRWDNAHFAGYGYGWRLSDLDGQWKVAHTGTLSGMYSSLALLPERKVGVVLLINGEGEDARTALMQAALKHYTAPADTQGVDGWLDQLAQARAPSPTEADPLPDNRATAPAPANALQALQGRYRDPWLGEASLCPVQGRLRFSVDKSPRLQADVLQVGTRWVLRWDTLEPSAQAWLQPTAAVVPTLDLRAIDPDIDFSYDYQDLHFTRIGDCAGSERARH